MTNPWQTLVHPDQAGHPSVGSNEQSVPVATILHNLQTGLTLPNLVERHNLTLAQLIAALAHEALGTDDASLPGPELIQPRKPAHPNLQNALTEPALAPLLPQSPKPARLSLSAALLQIFDFWHPSHEAAQQADDLGESLHAPYWHMIAHRREPDPANARYWSRRVAPNHPIAAPLEQVAHHQGWTGAWSPSRFIDACAQARPGSSDETRLRRIQRAEMSLLLDATRLD